MFLRPTPAPTGNDIYQPTIYPTTPYLPAAQQPASPACGCQHHTPAPVYTPAPAPRPSIAPYVAGGVAAVGGVAVIGLIAIGLLLAFAVSALSIAVVAVVLRTLLNSGSPQGGSRRR
jgi:hypothetical protein